MPIDHSFYTLLLFISASVSLLLIWNLWVRRNAPGASGLFIAIIGDGIWSLAYAFEILRPTLAQKIFWAQVEFIGIALIPMGMIFFALEHTGREKWNTPGRSIGLSIPAFITILLTFTNGLHGQIWTSIQMPESSVGALYLEHGQWFWFIWTPFSYLLLLGTAILLIQHAIQTEWLYRTQSIIILTGLFIPWLGNVVYLADLSPGIDLTPLTFAVSNIIIAIGFSYYGLMEVLPVAYSSIFSAIGDAVLVLDTRERIVDINPQGKKLLNEDDRHIIGKNVRALLPAWNKWISRMSQGEDIEYEIQTEAERNIYAVRLAPIQNLRKQNIGQTIIFHDISELRKASEELADASRFKTQLLANFSHDLRSPLGAIMGYGEMLRDGMFGMINDEQKNASAEILDSAQVVMTFVDNLLGQAQIETGKTVIHETPFLVKDIISPLKSTLKFHAEKKGLTLNIEFDPELPIELMGDSYWLRQIVLNLVNNAVKFTDTGSVSVRFLCLNENEWSIQVQDTGIGIPENEQRKIFEAFEQSSNNHNRKQTGFGLGLAIVSQLTVLMGGKIMLESQEGQGSLFTVILPMKLVAATKKSG